MCVLSQQIFLQNISTTQTLEQGVQYTTRMVSLLLTLNIFHTLF